MKAITTPVALGIIPRLPAAVHVLPVMVTILLPGPAAVLPMATALPATIWTAPPTVECALLDRIHWEGLR